MCGIAGWIGPEANEHRVKQMADALVHRGPDGAGIWSDEGVVLAHRRLAIIDIEGGHQPMTSASGRWILVFNGEIYNFQDLKADVLKHYPYRTHSDTEVVLAALDKWGGDAVTRLEGMFAIAAWDTVERRLLLARDGQGLKPLYFSAIEGGVVFGSEVTALLAAGVKAKVNERSLGTFLDLRFVPSPNTLFSDINKLAPGHYLWINQNGTARDPQPFAFKAPLIDRNVSMEDVTEKLLTAFLSAVDRQMIADVPVGVLLSGGVDSGAVAAAAVRSGQAVSTFCVGYTDNHPSNEFSDARRTAEILGTEHHESYIDVNSAVDVMPKVIKHLEEPMVTTSIFSYYLLCESVAKHRKVVVSGQGIDEPWAGYGRHRVASLRSILGPLVRTFPSLLPRVVKQGDTWQRLQEALGSKNDIEQMIGLHTLFPGAGRAAIRSDGSRGHTFSEIERLSHFLPDNGTFLERLLALETRTSLPDNLLLLADKLSMASGLEVRVPMLDPIYLNIVESLPANLRRSGFLAGTGKLLHKKVCEALVPKEVINRPKKGFQTPIEEWLKVGLGDHIYDLVDHGRSFTRQFLDISTAKRLIQAHRSGRHGNLERQLFAIWVLEEWHRAFFHD